MTGGYTLPKQTTKVMTQIPAWPELNISQFVAKHHQSPAERLEVNTKDKQSTSLKVHAS